MAFGLLWLLFRGGVSVARGISESIENQRDSIQYRHPNGLTYTSKSGTRLVANDHRCIYKYCASYDKFPNCEVGDYILEDLETFTLVKNFTLEERRDKQKELLREADVEGRTTYMQAVVRNPYVYSPVTYTYESVDKYGKGIRRRQISYPIFVDKATGRKMLLFKSARRCYGNEANCKLSEEAEFYIDLHTAHYVRLSDYDSGYLKCMKKILADIKECVDLGDMETKESVERFLHVFRENPKSRGYNPKIGIFDTNTKKNLLGYTCEEMQHIQAEELCDVMKSYISQHSYCKKYFGNKQACENLEKTIRRHEINEEAIPYYNEYQDKYTEQYGYPDFTKILQATLGIDDRVYDR